MAHEAKEWNVCTFRCNRTKSGGLHIYVPSNVVKDSLELSGLYPINPEEIIMAKTYPLQGTGKLAKILLKLKKVDKNELKQV